VRLISGYSKCVKVKIRSIRHWSQDPSYDDMRFMNGITLKCVLKI